jgi:RNA polymerase sigma factor (sigma-70 family)
MPLRRTSFIRHLVRLAGAPAGAAPSDGDLLERFARERDEAAFHELLHRHAPLVAGVCRRVVHNDHDAEDAFQATFLVLVQKAATVRQRTSLASWLHGVAYRCAARVRAANVRRGRHEARAAAPAPVPPPDLTWREVRQVIDEELCRLPEKYRAPLVLCYLRGKTQCEAARELGWGEGVLRGRLDRGREQLRARLVRRGVALSAGLLATGLATGTAGAGASPALLDSTLQAALLVAAGRAVVDVVSGPVAVLTKGALRTMQWTNVKLVTTCVLLTAGAFGAGAVLGRQTTVAEPTAGQRQDESPQVKDRAKAEAPPTTAEKPKEKLYEFSVKEKPWSEVFQWLSDQSGLAFVGTVRPTGTFTFSPPKGKQYTFTTILDIVNEALQSGGAQKFILLRREQTLALVPADEKIDPTLVPRVALDDLEKRGRLELVKVVVPLTAVTARDITPDVKKMLGPFGEVVSLNTTNQLIVQDTAGNLQEVRRMIKDAEARLADKKPGSAGR